MISPSLVEIGESTAVRPHRGTGAIRCALIETVGDFNALAAGWNSLLRNSTASCPFLTWEWLHAWSCHLSGSSRLRILAVSAADELIALAPFRLTTGVARLPCLDMLGTGEAGSDYLDVIIRSGWEAESLDAIERFVVSQNRPLRLTHLASAAMARQLVGRLGRRGWTNITSARGTCPYIPLAGYTWDSYLATLGASHRANVRRRLRALEQQFEVRFQRVTGERERRDALERLAVYHERRFDSRGTAFGTPKLRAFHDEATARALDAGWLRMFVLRIDDTPVAVMYGLLYNHIFYFYQHGFDDQYRQYSIGLVLMALSIRAAIEEGATEFDMLWGTEPYKFLWARHTRELRNIHLFPGHVGGRLHKNLFRARRQLSAFIHAF
jgi:CelD/BcsL family acetyltransferase involved in cellulose biosynthesis